MEDKNVIVGAIVTAVLIFGCLMYFTPGGRYIWNRYAMDLQKVDDISNYETVKKVEDSCRSMISSYESDKMTYEQYRYSEDLEKQSWGEQAKMRANKTAATYNNYIMKNSFVWKNNIPEDIREKLDYIE